MENLLEQLLLTVITAVGAGLSTLIGLWFKRLADNVKAKTKNEKVNEVLYRVRNLVKDAVLTVQQTFTEQLKKDGKFDKEQQKIAFQKAIDIILANLTEEAKDILNEIYGDIYKWLEVQIESIIALWK
jgi:Na+-translocating ferredoxin:NAD+ oxidoreductase RnfG subunit